MNDCDCDPYDPGNLDGCVHDHEPDCDWHAILPCTCSYANPPVEEPIDPNPLDVDIDEAVSITVGEGLVDVKRRHLGVLMPLPKYLKDPQRPELGEDHALSLQLLDHDIREAMAKAARKLENHAQKYRVTGYDWSLDDIVYDIPRPRTVMATLVIERS